MSWDILIQDFGGYTDFDSIPDDFKPKPLGQKSELIANICDQLPGADFSDPSWGLVDTIDGSIEINIGDEELCDSIMLHVRGGLATFEQVKDIVAVCPGSAFDMATADFFHPDTSRKSFDRWRDYRDQAVAGYQEQASRIPLMQRIKNFFTR